MGAVKHRLLEDQDKLVIAIQILIDSNYVFECICGDIKFGNTSIDGDIKFGNTSIDVYAYAGYLFNKKDKFVSDFDSWKEMKNFIEIALGYISNKCFCDYRNKKDKQIEKR